MKNKNWVDLSTVVVMGIFSYGLQIPWLGFFQDDWNFIFYSSALGSQGLIEFLTWDGRPGATWIYILGFKILGYDPMAWQLFSVVIRIITSVNFWLILNKLWPVRRHGNLIASVIFLAYPFFTLQPLSVAYAPHLVAYLSFTLSILLMIKALEEPKKYIPYSAIAIIATFTHLFTVEYFVGLEILRSVVLWFVVSSKSQEETRRAVFRKALITYIPYFLALATFVIWRIFFLSSLGVRNNPLQIIGDSGQRITLVATNIIADLVLMLVNSWFKLLDPDLFVIGPIRNYYVIAISAISGVCFYYLSKSSVQENETTVRANKVFVIGLIVFAAGMIAPYAIGYIVHEKLPPWNSRFSLPALPGLALMSSALLEFLIMKPRVQRIFLATLIGLLIGSHNQNSLNFKSAWEKQERLYQQLIWRAPSITPDTAIVAGEEILGYMGDYPTSFAINTIYSSKQANPIPYWFFTVSNVPFSPEAGIIGEPLNAFQATAEFRGNNRNSIFIIYEPENNQCLWILRQFDKEYKHQPAIMRNAVQYANLTGIHTNESKHDLFSQIVDENKDTWCYFYQKADLARQTGEWESVIRFWNEAEEKGYRPDNGFEYIVFIEAFAHSGNWEEAFQLTKTANKATSAMYFILCPTWEKLAGNTEPNAQKDVFVNKAYGYLECGP